MSGHTKVHRTGAKQIDDWQVPEIAVAPFQPRTSATSRTTRCKNRSRIMFQVLASSGRSSSDEEEAEGKRPRGERCCSRSKADDASVQGRRLVGGMLPLRELMTAKARENGQGRSEACLLTREGCG